MTAPIPTLTISDLRASGACHTAVDTFARVCPDGMPTPQSPAEQVHMLRTYPALLPYVTWAWDHGLIPWWSMRDADLSRANLRYADLRRADLSRANLYGADLRSAYLHNADLSGADLRYANLHNADLSGADLRYADLRDAVLRYANLHNADLRDANLRNAGLRDANLRYAVGAPQPHPLEPLT